MRHLLGKERGARRSILGGVACGVGLGGAVCDDGYLRCSRGMALGEVGGQVLGRLGHIRAVERSRDGDGHRAALGVAHKGVELLERLGRSGNHGLLRAVVVHGPRFARLLGEFLHRLCIELQDGAHSTGVRLGGSGHELSAVAYEREAFGVGIGAGEGERSHLAEREPATATGTTPCASSARAQARSAANTPLGVRRLVSSSWGALEALGARAGTRGVCRLEDGAGGGLALGKLHAHAGCCAPWPANRNAT